MQLSSGFSDDDFLVHIVKTNNNEKVRKVIITCILTSTA